jgi:hypothetical protein
MISFVIVNDRMPGPDASCMLCCEKIGDAYVRDLQTRIFYCDQRCLGGHVKMTWLQRERSRRRASEGLRPGVRVKLERNVGPLFHCHQKFQCD